MGNRRPIADIDGGDDSMTLPTFVVIGAMKLRDRLTERLAPDLRRFENLLGYRVPSDWGW